MAGPDFDSIKHLNPYNVEYWEARELQPMLGYKSSWQNFEGVIKKAIVSCESTGNLASDHFNDAVKPIKGGKGAVQEAKDYYLSRLACYLIAMNGDPRKKEIAAAQNYFAVATRKNEMHQLLQEHEERIQMRLQVAEGNKSLGEAAADAGVRSQMFGVFHDAGYLGQYTLTAEAIANYKGIPEGGDILDFMGSEELASNLFRIVQANGQLRRQKIAGEDDAIRTHYNVGREVRDTLKRLGATMPEDLPTAASIRAEIERQNRASRHIRQQQRQQKDQDQGTLFDA